ncbi:MAG: 50S ribosomal protein L19 [Patescibacteria group bacterium]|nr:50S ribosomal protein L19 [Patescibacteria group bacterium]
METKIKNFTQQYLKTDLPDIKPGDTVKVHQKISSFSRASASAKKAAKSKPADKKEGERIQVFEGVIIAIKHGKGINGSFTVRKLVDGVGVEKIFPLHSPTLQKIEIVSHGRVRRAKLYYLRHRVGRSAKVKRKDVSAPESKKETKTKE